MISPRVDFSILEADPPPPGVRRYLHVDALRGAAGPAILAVMDGKRALLIPVPSEVRVKADRRSAGVHLYGISLTEAGTTTPYACVECVKPHLRDLFEVIVSDVIRGSAGSPERPDIVAATVLERWRELLDREPRPTPGGDALRGIWGELWHVREIVRRGRLDLTYWTGFRNAIWDIVAENAAIEVKTTTNRAAWKVRIASEHQLDTSTRDVVLSVLRVDAGGDDGESLPDLVGSLQAEGVDPLDLARALDAAGLDWHQVGNTGGSRFVLLEHRAWLVEDGFPRITAASFTNGALPLHVSGVAYDIDLSALLDDAMSTATWSTVLARIAQ